MSASGEPGPAHAGSEGADAAIRRTPYERDPLAPVLDLGRRDLRVGLILGLIGALLLHGTCVVWGMVSLFDLGAFATDVKLSVDERLRSTIDVQVAPPSPPPKAAPAPPAPPPEPPPPEPKATPRPPVHQPEPAPAAAQAGKVLTREPSPDQPLNLTDQGFVTGNGVAYAGGVTTSTGTSKTAVSDQRARGGGARGTGTAPAPQAPAPARDLSRAATPTTLNWNCGFPPEADRDQVNFARVTLVVTVGPDGRARSVTVLRDPGHGFGRQARQCALGMRYHPGFDRNGHPVTKTTPPFTVRFNR